MLVAAAKETITNPSITAVVVADTAYARDVAAAVSLARLAARRPTIAYTASIVKYVIRADSAFVDVFSRSTTQVVRDHLEAFRITLVRRAKVWTVTGSAITGVS